MAVEELLFWFIGVPAIGYAAAATWMRLTIRHVAERELGFLRAPGVMSRFLVFLVHPTTPILFGLVLLFSALGAPADPASESVVRWLGIAWAVSSILTVLSQAWLVVRRRASAYRGENFTRVLVLSAIAETIILYTFMVAILVFGQVVRGPTEPVLSEAGAAALVRACQFTIIGSFGAPLVALLSNRLPDLTGRRFVRAIVFAMPGDALALLSLVLALQQLRSV